MFTQRSAKWNMLEDGWTVVTRDQSLAVHVEHTVAITEGEPEVLTQLQKGTETVARGQATLKSPRRLP